MTRETKTSLYHKLRSADTILPPGAVVCHEKSGDLYIIDKHTIREHDGEVITCYTCGSIPFTRPFNEFSEVVPSGMGYAPRFTLISESPCA